MVPEMVALRDSDSAGWLEDAPSLADRDFKDCSCFLGDLTGFCAGGDIDWLLTDIPRLSLSKETNRLASELNSAAAREDSGSS
jgi:hypothetical protein